MGSESLGRMFILAIIISIVLSIPIFLIGNKNDSFGFFFGSIWSTLNLWAWKKLMEEFFGSQRHFLLALILIIKIPLLYLIGGWVLMNISFSLLWGIIGFHFPFVLLGYAIIHQAKQEP